MTDLLNYNVFGSAKVSDNKISVTLVAYPVDRKPVSHTVTKDFADDFSGETILAIRLSKKSGYDIVVKEMGETMIVGHPDVDAVINEALSVIRFMTGNK